MSDAGTPTAVIRMYAAREEIYPREAKGRYASLRWACVWLHGGSIETIAETIRKGRNNTMPAFDEFLGDAKVQLLAAYVYSLSNSAKAETAKPELATK